MMMEKLVELLARETEVLGENLPQFHFVQHKPHMLPVRDPRGGKPATNRLSYGTALHLILVSNQWYWVYIFYIRFIIGNIFPSDTKTL
jgi:hypothetical protein